MPYAQTISNDNGYDWYQCNCCPYGYHIDLDFVRYCETIGQQVERSGSIKRRRDRRRQRQSMEVLLGLTAPLFVNHTSNLLPSIQDNSKSPLINEALEDAVSDFERTLQRSKKKPTTNLPDVTAVSGESGSRDFDTVSIESCNLSPSALQNIREQMALSLERTKELEEKVKLLPTLKAQLSSMKEENRQLRLQLQSEEESKLNKLNSNYLFNRNTCPRNRSHSFSNIDGVGEIKKKPPPPPPRRDFGVMVGVLTRNVGVGHQTPQTKTVSTATLQQPPQHVDRWFTEKNVFLNGPVTNKVTITKGTQTIFPKEKRDVCIQAGEIVKVASREYGVQTVEGRKVLRDVAVAAVAAQTSAYTQSAKVECVTVGVSGHTLTDEYCAKCRVAKATVGVGTTEDFTLSPPISLAALSVPRSKSFHLGEEKLSLRNRTIGCQYEPQQVCHKSMQHEVKTATKHSQHDIIPVSKGVQYENTGQSKATDTDTLKPVMKHKSSECLPEKVRTADVGCNTKELPTTPCLKCRKEALAEEATKKDDAATPSRIPRPQKPTTPVEIRKFTRQDTYTKISPSEKPGLSALELIPTTKSPSEVSPFEKVKQSYKLPEVTKTPKNGVTAQHNDERKVQAAVAEIALCQPSSPRKKCTPSKEMQAAMKVLNDSLQKNQGRDAKGQMKNANAIVEAEWFKISSVVAADPVDVEDYLDCFEDINSNLLEYIVNMVDASGNTAMHYAVSHGNFDVVSILLDSKVCDINKQNKAGYTSVMLVSLAEVRSQTHANVVRRLFSLADVNIRAKQHGQTALMLAVSHGRLDMVTMLLEAGADINIQDEDGSTALMCAAEHGHVDIVKHFLSHPDCDSSIFDVDGSTALKIAMEAGHRHIGVLLYAHERNIHGSAPARPKKSKSTSASPKTPSSPLMQRSVNRALSTTK